MRTLSFAMNVTLDGFVSAPGDDLGWGTPNDELFQWWSDRLATAELLLYGRRVWEGMSAHWPTADQQPGVEAAHAAYARRWREVPKVVFSSSSVPVDGDTRLVTGDAVAEIARLRTEGEGRVDIAGATLAGAALRAGLVDEVALATFPVLVGDGLRFFPRVEDWVRLRQVETRPFPDGVLVTRYVVER